MRVSKKRLLLFTIGRTGGAVGAQVAAFVIPSVAVISLGGGPLLTAVLAICQWAAFPLLAIPFGWLVDRHEQQRVTLGVSADSLQVLAMIAAGAMATIGVLMQWHLIIIAILIGAAAVMFDLSIMSAINSKMKGDSADRAVSLTSLSRNMGLLVGPVLGGILVDIFDANIAFIATSVFFAISALGIALSLGTLPGLSDGSTPKSFPIGDGAFEGVKFMLRNSTLMSFAIFSGSLNLGMQWIQASYFVYAYEVISASPTAVGVIFGIGAGFGVMAALFAPRVVRKFGLYKPLAMSAALTFFGWMSLLVAEVNAWIGLGLSSILVSVSLPVVFVAQAAARRDLAPAGVQGRLYSAMTLMAFITVPIGYLIGGSLGEFVSVRFSIATGLLVVGVGAVVAAYAVLRTERKLSSS